MITFDIPPAILLGLVVSTILPLLVGLVTTRVVHPGWKAAILAALASATGLGTELLAALNSGALYNLGTGVVYAISSFLVGVGLYFGIWKPTGVAVAAQDFGTNGKHAE